MKTKVCTTCKEEKDLSLFSKNKTKTSGYQTYCKLCAHARRAQWARDNTDKVRVYRLAYTYGLTPEEFDSMLSLQENKCKVCKAPFTKTPHIDHDHTCCGPLKACKKCVRGLLCSRCNIFIGYLEKYEHATEVAQYLSDHSSKTV